MKKIICIIQARYDSSRFPGKMLMELGGESLVRRAWRIACEAFGKENCVIAIPLNASIGNLKLSRHLGNDTEVYLHEGEENDVLGRFYWCAKQYGATDDTVIVRYTADDWRKDADSLRRVASGERLPVEMGGEAFTFAQLVHAHKTVTDPFLREHLTYALFDSPPPLPSDDGLPWSIDTMEDYAAVLKSLEVAA